MKIVIDARESGTTTGRYVDKLVEYLHRLKSEHEFVLLAKTHRVEFLKSIAPSFTVVETPYKEFTFGEQLGFLGQIKSLQPDLVHFVMVQQPVLYHGKVVTTMNDLTTVRFKNPSKNPVIFTLKQQVYAWVNRVAARKSAALLTYTEYVKQDVADFAHIDPKKCTVTYLAADPIPDTAEPIPALAGKQFIMYVGRPMAHKNLNRLVEAFKLLQKTHPDLHLVLAGKKDVLYQRLEQKLHQESVANVYFTDFVSEGGLRWLYEHTAAYCFPSLSEGFGLPPLEAMLHGAPVVASNATCIPEVCGDAAHYFDPYDVEAMAEAINDVLTDKKLRAALVHKGTAQVKKYSWRTMAEQTLAVYSTVLND